MGRKGHKEGCQCIVCQKVNAKATRLAVVATSVEVKLSIVKLGSLPCGSMFELGGEKYAVGEKTEHAIVSNQVRWIDDVEFGGWQFVKQQGFSPGTMVKPL